MGDIVYESPWTQEKGDFRVPLGSLMSEYKCVKINWVLPHPQDLVFSWTGAPRARGKGKRLEPDSFTSEYVIELFAELSSKLWFASLSSLHFVVGWGTASRSCNWKVVYVHHTCKQSFPMTSTELPKEGRDSPRTVSQPPSQEVSKQNQGLK